LELCSVTVKTARSRNGTPFSCTGSSCRALLLPSEAVAKILYGPLSNCCESTGKANVTEPCPFAGTAETPAHHRDVVGVQQAYGYLRHAHGRRLRQRVMSNVSGTLKEKFSVGDVMLMCGGSSTGSFLQPVTNKPKNAAQISDCS
jgi:hypothetical protein